jgi:hypothetical protein
MKGTFENTTNENNLKMKNIYYVDNDKTANKFLCSLLTGKECCIGVDIEASVEMSRFGILCLIQVFFL